MSFFFSGNEILSVHIIFPVEKAGNHGKILEKCKGGVELIDRFSYLRGRSGLLNGMMEGFFTRYRGRISDFLIV